MVPPGDNLHYNTAPSYEVTVESFLNKLRHIYRGLGLKELNNIGVVCPDDTDTKPDESQLLRNLGLGADVCSWSEGKPEMPSEKVYERLEEFVTNHVPSILEVLRKKWEHNLEVMKKLGMCPGVATCINGVISTADKDELKKQYDINQLPECDDVNGIIKTLGCVLFWFACLPCTEEAKRAQASYRSSLKTKLALLLNPVLSEFQQMRKEAEDNPALLSMLAEHCYAEVMRNSESEDRQFEKIDKENSYEMSKH